MHEFPGNSNKSKENNPPAKKIEKVVTGEVVVKQKGVGTKFKEIFFGGDAKTAALYVTADVLLPALRNLLVDSVTKGAERLVFGESVHTRRRPEMRSSEMRNSQVLYNRMRRESIPTRGVEGPRRPSSVYQRERREFEDHIVETKAEADLVVERLMDIIDVYDVVSLADLKELLGLEHDQHTDNKWGWTHLKNVEIRAVRDGYLIALPSIQEL
jgi:hypothetical protein